MTSNLLCCQELVGITNIPTPFGKVIVLDYHDGPTLGLAQCAECSRAYKFNLVATDEDGKFNRDLWDAGTELRIFALAEVALQDFQQCIELISGFQTPIWPLWIIRWHTIPSDDRSVLIKEIDMQIQALNVPSIVIECSDLLETLFAVKSSPSVTPGSTSEWFNYMRT
jgi:hypothetical protein